MFGQNLDCPIGLCCDERTCLFDFVSCSLLVLDVLHDAIFCFTLSLSLENPFFRCLQSWEAMEMLLPLATQEDRDSMYSYLSDHDLSLEIISWV